MNPHVKPPPQLQRRIKKANRLVRYLGYPKSIRKQHLYDDEMLMDINDIEHYLEETKQRLADNEVDLSKCCKFADTCLRFLEFKNRLEHSAGILDDDVDET